MIEFSVLFLIHVYLTEHLVIWKEAVNDVLMQIGNVRLSLPEAVTLLWEVKSPRVCICKDLQINGQKYRDFKTVTVELQCENLNYYQENISCSQIFWYLFIKLCFQLDCFLADWSICFEIFTSLTNLLLYQVSLSKVKSEVLEPF